MTAKARILILGQDVHTVDFTSPALPPGMSAEKVLAGLAKAKASLEAQGYVADELPVQPDPATAQAEIEAFMAGKTYDVVGIGAGSAMQQPLAIAIISGLVLQMPLVLIVLPVLLSLHFKAPERAA